MDIDEGIEEEHVCNCCNMGWTCFANVDDQHLVVAIVAAFVHQAMKDRTPASSSPLGPL